MPTLRIIIAGHDHPPIPISLPPHASVQDLMDAVFESCNTFISPTTHRLRFVVAGKSLSPNAPTLRHAGLTDGTFVHCAVSNRTPLDENDSGYHENRYMPCEHDDGLVTIDLGPGDLTVVDDAHEDGSFHDWCWGFVLGALLGLIMMILALDRSIALSSKWKKGIGCGTLVNIFFGIFLLANDRLR